MSDSTEMPHAADTAARPDSYADSAQNLPTTPYVPPTRDSQSNLQPGTPQNESAYATPATEQPQALDYSVGAGAATATTDLADAPATKEALAAPADSGSAEALAGSGAVGAGATKAYARKPWYKRWWVWLIAFLALAAVVLVVVLPVWFVAVKPHRDSKSVKASGSTNPESPTGATSGGNGSTIVMEDGTNFTYINNFGGFWVYDPANPFNNSAQPNSWTPPLSTPWNFSTDRIFGVNLGGLFELEPFITPALYQTYSGSIDEWSLDEAMRAGSNGSTNILDTMEAQYSGFITEQDIAEIAGAGLNWIRLPIPFWAIEAWDDVGVNSTGQVVTEPFLARTCWPYILQVMSWARKYGLRIDLDLHTIPGSQNGYNHSGKYGVVNFLNGVMGIANAERALEYIRVITEFISQPDYLPLIPMFSVVNEPLLATIGLDTLTNFYLHAYWVMRNITGIGEGNGPYMVIHDGFEGTDYWAGFLAGSDRIVLDTHPYFAFDNLANTEPVNVTANGSTSDSVYGGIWPLQACDSWGAEMNTSRVNFGVTIAGEFSNGINDCGLWVRGVNISATYGGNCDYWEDWESWSDETKEGLKTFILASMDALGDWFFWTWKIDPSLTSDSVEAPLWSYKLGLEQGWIPADPRTASGTCESLGYVITEWNQTYSSWATGGAGAGEIAASSVIEYGMWPPTSIAGVATESVSYLPQYTKTATVVRLPAASTFSYATVPTSVDWYDASDTGSAPTPIASCTYPDAWNATASAIPTEGCGGAAYARREIAVEVLPRVLTAPPAGPTVV